MNNEFEFKGKWRSYQARVLSKVDKYLEDGKLHIIAAPGSGKTTLGIECIVRLGKPALILVPSLTIRDQWKARINEAFLKEGQDIEKLVSLDLEKSSLITITTYQALHADSHIKEIKKAGVQVLCLDECHHLRNEWWKALEDFKKEMGPLMVISLTATPPYDSTPAMWERYMEMCGPVDEEITIPELVKEGSLCPHQDYVYFNYPTDEEQTAIEKVSSNAAKAFSDLVQDEKLKEAVAGHKFLRDDTPLSDLLEDKEYLSAVLIYAFSNQLQLSAQLEKMTDQLELPVLDAYWMEILLNYLLFKASDDFSAEPEYIKRLTADLKAWGLIESKKFMLSSRDSVDKTVVKSKAKTDSIVAVADSEYSSLKDDLRMLVLADYIREEVGEVVGLEDEEPDTLGVLPFFEALRRHFVRLVERPKLGILSGSVVVIEASAKAALLAEVGPDKVTFSQIGMLLESDYVRVNPIGDGSFLTAAITKLFEQGEIQILVGTRSLLGEGWDSPCINSLILASFVGSYMLSNQMRGRAIRVDASNPDKTSNIWHLVCLAPKENTVEGEEPLMYSEDMDLLKRRMEHFMGLSYDATVIESGVDRLSIIPKNITKGSVDKINKRMLELSKNRDELKKNWEQALTTEDKDRTERLAVVRTSTVNSQFIIRSFTPGDMGFFRFAYHKIKSLGKSPAQYMLKVVGDGIIKALNARGLLENPECKVSVEDGANGGTCISLIDESTIDKEMFSQCLAQFLAPIDNQRYIFVNTGKNGNIFYAVPDIFGKRKEDATLFYDCLKGIFKNYKLVYTKNPAGQELLLEGRIKELANTIARVETCQRVKIMK